MACLLNHTLYPSLHPPLFPSSYSSSTSCLLVVCRREERPPCSDTHTHVDTHLRDVSLPIPPASSRHSPLAVPSTYTCSFPSLFFPSLFLSLSPSLHLCLSSNHQPPPSPHPTPHTLCVTAAGKKEKCSGQQK